MAYINCPECGQKALSVATRCPKCGTAFERQVVRTPTPRRFPPGLLVAGIGVTVLVAISARLDLGISPAPKLTAGLTPPPQPAPRPTTPTAPAPHPAAESLPKPTDSSPRPAAESVPARPAVADTSTHLAAAPLAVTPQAARAPTPPPPPPTEPTARKAEPNESAPGAGTERRYASTWLNVRAQRSSKAAVVRVLKPGELVLVGMQQEGWYPVMNAAETAGFVDRRLLAATPPTGSP